MSFIKFLKDKILLIILSLFGVASIEILLLAYKIGVGMRIYIGVSSIVLLFLSIIIEYENKEKFYSTLEQNINELEDKYLIPEVTKTPDFIEGIILKEILQETEKSMIEKVNKYRDLQEEYKEYIELWIHEIKTPIATSKMVIENNKTEVTKSIEEELNKIENYIEQALFYARSNTLEKDYYITKSNLREIVNLSIIKNKSILLSNEVNIKLNDLDKTVYTDSKWIVFVINQIIQNSIKYSKKQNKEISIYAKNDNEKVILYIKDNGIGIIEGEISRVFDKGFTGTNGRTQNKKSTGIGLYLCKKLCNKLGIGIEVSSEENKGTEVRIVFPKNSYTDF